MPESHQVEIPDSYLPEGVSGSAFDPVVLRSAAEAHCRHRFDHDMDVKAWVILFLLDQYETELPRLKSEKNTWIGQRSAYENRAEVAERGHKAALAREDRLKDKLRDERDALARAQVVHLAAVQGVLEARLAWQDEVQYPISTLLSLAWKKLRRKRG